jgi:hypothetical protein
VTTAELAIIVTGTVGLGAPALAAFFGWLREKQHAKRERVAKDLDDLRALLDELLPTMFDHTNRLLALEGWMRDQTIRRDREDPAPSTADTRRQMYASNARLVIRRGRDDVLVTSLGRYLKVTDEAKAELDTIYAENDVFDLSDEELEQRAHVYWQAYEDFGDTCKSVVGSVS